MHLTTIKSLFLVLANDRLWGGEGRGYRKIFLWFCTNSMGVPGSQWGKSSKCQFPTASLLDSGITATSRLCFPINSWINVAIQRRLRWQWYKTVDLFLATRPCFSSASKSWIVLMTDVDSMGGSRIWQGRGIRQAVVLYCSVLLQLLNK